MSKTNVSKLVRNAKFLKTIRIPPPRKFQIPQSVSYDKLIVVTGMPHSGTTIFTYLLQQHPQITLFAHTIPKLLETWITDPDVLQLVNYFIARCGTHVLVKRPSLFVELGDYLLANMPKAKYICCHRDFDQIVKSWSGPHCISATAKYSNDQLGLYNTWMSIENYFCNRLPFCTSLHHADFVNDPQSVLNSITDWLQLERYVFDVSQVSLDEEKSIKKLFEFYSTDTET